MCVAGPYGVKKLDWPRVQRQGHYLHINDFFCGVIKNEKKIWIFFNVQTLVMPKV